MFFSNFENGIFNTRIRWLFHDQINVVYHRNVKKFHILKPGIRKITKPLYKLKTQNPDRFHSNHDHFPNLFKFRVH